MGCPARPRRVLAAGSSALDSATALHPLPLVHIPGVFGGTIPGLWGLDVVKHRRDLLVFALPFLIACAPVGPASSQPGAGTGATAADPAQAPKTLTIGQLSAVKAYALWDFSNTDGGGTALAEIHSNGLVSADASGNLVGQLALRLPSVEDGSIVVLPDGRMRTTWKLRANVKWHDGAPFTADDVVLGWQIITHPELASGGAFVLTNIDSVQAMDPSTVDITWKSTFFQALLIGFKDLWPSPVHLIGEAFKGDKDIFRSLPYFTTEYVHLGAFRLVDFGLGEQQVFERFDDYFQGRPKLDRIIIRTIPDPNVLLVNLQAGTVDMTSEKTLPLDIAWHLREEWNQNGMGTVVQRQDNWRYMWFQFDPQWARPIEVSQDVRIRRGLLYGLDRDALREFLFPGVLGTGADSFMPAPDPRATAVGQPFARYPYDPARAAQELSDAGWRRAADGSVLNQAGERVPIEVRGVATDTKEVAIIAENWRRLGLDVKETISPLALQRDLEYKSKFSGLEVTARSTGDQIFPRFDSRLHARAENRWGAANNGHYGNPVLDGLIDKLYRTVDRQEQGVVLREMGELMADELPALPTYYRLIFAAVGKGVRALDDYAGTGGGGGSGPGLLSRNAHLWDRD
ncbi:MAG: hypothetical protein HW416_2497 [Chloroflexi bacterium]|nr:hypothetical protein [Chloroflexota bacterium]